MEKGVKKCEYDLLGASKKNKPDALDQVLELIKKDKGKHEIRKELGLTASALSNRLKRLEAVGCIELWGKYGIKYISSSHKDPKVTRNQVHKKLNKRGHAFNFKVLFPNEKNDIRTKDKVVREHKKKRIALLEFGSYQLKYKGYTIWINKESLTIYSNNYYCSDDALHSKFRQLKEVDSMVQYLKERYGITGIYGIEVFREHYGLIFNKFAKWLLSKGRKLSVENKGGKEILWVDDSRKDDMGLKEFESKDPIKINTADDFFESKDATGWHNDTPQVNKNTEDIASQNKVIAKSMEVLEGYTEQIALHLKVEKKQLFNLEKQDTHFERQNKHFEDQTKILGEIRDALRSLK